MESIISGCGKFNRSKDKDLIEARSALVKAWIDNVERAVEKVDKNLPDMMARHIADICYRESERLKKQATMERKIGEIFEYKGDWYQCAKTGFSCADCDIRNDCSDPFIGPCASRLRKDGTQVRFKKLEKVGEPYTEGNSIVSERMFQKYRLYEKNFFLNEKNLLLTSMGDIVSIEIKQTKEDMEEKNGKRAIDFVVEPPRLTGDKPEHRLNLKPFSLEAARSGKPVCTRDGRKARIICFDVKGDICPIIALVEENGMEVTKSYDMNGRANYKDADNYDLMMLPEKKEGWVNVYDADTTFYFVEGRVYDTKEEAIKHINPDHDIYTTTVKIEWEE